MSAPKDVLKEVKSILEADATLAAYVKKVFLGVRENVAAADFPCIMLEPATNTERVQMNTTADQTLTILISAQTRTFDLDAQVVGSTNYKGVMELEVDIKKALSAKFPSLNNKAINFRFGRTEFQIDATPSDGPARGFVMEVEIDYRTSFTART